MEQPPDPLNHISPKWGMPITDSENPPDALTALAAEMANCSAAARLDLPCDIASVTRRRRSRDKAWAMEQPPDPLNHISPKWGMPITDSENPPDALIAFFPGWLGIHKFYLGKNTAGVIMLAVSLLGLILIGIPTFIMGFIAFVEFIIYLTRSDEEFERVYVQGNKSWF